MSLIFIFKWEENIYQIIWIKVANVHDGGLDVRFVSTCISIDDSENWAIIFFQSTLVL